MRIVKRIFSGLIVLIAILMVGAYLLPRNVMVARSIEINASAAKVFPSLNGLKAGADWSPWLNHDPDAKLTYSGPDTGVGSTLEWASEHPQVGNGREEIVESVENEKVVSALDFGGKGTAMAAFTLTEVNGKTTVTWDLNTDMGMNPIGRYMGLMMDSWIGGDYEKGLSNLKALIEG